MLLTGRPPAGGKDTFLGFVDAAWLDAGFANEEDFTCSLQFAQKRLKKMSGADFITEASLLGLV
jgi:hypothetical protein